MGRENGASPEEMGLTQEQLEGVEQASKQMFDDVHNSERWQPVPDAGFSRYNNEAGAMANAAEISEIAAHPERAGERVMEKYSEQLKENIAAAKEVVDSGSTLVGLDVYSQNKDFLDKNVKNLAKVEGASSLLEKLLVLRDAVTDKFGTKKFQQPSVVYSDVNLPGGEYLDRLIARLQAKEATSGQEAA